MEDTINDAEIDQLEDIRRFGYPEYRTGDEESEYFALPPKRSYLMKDWTEWRVKVNNHLSDEVAKTDGREHQPERTLTAPLEKKTPKFFSGEMSIHGQRVKDTYGGNVITETDDTKTRIEKKIIDENFYLFGIPRLSVRRSLTRINGMPKIRITGDRSNYEVGNVSKLRRGSTGGIGLSITGRLFNGIRVGSSRASLHYQDNNAQRRQSGHSSSSISESRTSSLYDDTIEENEPLRTPLVRRESLNPDMHLKQLGAMQYHSINDNELSEIPNDPRHNIDNFRQRSASTGTAEQFRRLRRTPIDSGYNTIYLY